MSMYKDLSELINAGVITQETARNIEEYYLNKKDSSTNRLFIVFGILGAILVGLGIILIIAHNWDELSRNTKSYLAFLPLIMGQVVCGYTLMKRPDSVAWRESSSVFLFFGVGATISLITQIYNIPGDLSAFMLTWMLLCLPLIYIMQSSITSLLYIIGITYYAGETCYWSHPASESYLYWLLLLLALPYYYHIHRIAPASNFVTFHNWFVPLSIVIALGTVAHEHDELMFIAYFSLFGLAYITGLNKIFEDQNPRNNGYLFIGAMGTIVLLLTLSFDWFWEDLRNLDFQFNEMIQSPEFITATLITLLGVIALFRHLKSNPVQKLKPLAFVFILFVPTFILGFSSTISAVLINLYILATGLLIIRNGAGQNHLGVLNFGLMIIAALVICRFFDTDLSFILRGIMFLSVGAGFFVANYLMIKKRKAHEN